MSGRMMSSIGAVERISSGWQWWRNCAVDTTAGKAKLAPDFSEFIELLNELAVRYLIVGACRWPRRRLHSTTQSGGVGDRQGARHSGASQASVMYMRSRMILLSALSSIRLTVYMGGAPS